MNAATGNAKEMAIKMKLTLRQKGKPMDIIGEEDKVIQAYRGINIYAKNDGKSTVYVHKLGDFTTVPKARTAVDEWIDNGGLAK